MKKIFDPSVYLGKKTIYSPVPRAIGIRYVWDWCERSQKYRKREFGNRYEAFKRVQIGTRRQQRSKSFESFEDARRWREERETEDGESARRIPFKELVAAYFAHKRTQIRETTLQTYSNHSRHLAFFENFFVDQIDDRLIDRWLAEIKQPRYLEAQHSTRISYENELICFVRY